MPPQSLAVLATLVSFAPHGNRIELRLDRGSAELEWTSPGSFHFRRTLDGPLPVSDPPASGPVALQVDDTPAAVRMRSKYLDVAIQKRGVLVNVRGLDGAALMADLSEPKPEGALVGWERAAPPGMRFYGLGPLADRELDLRGKSIDSPVPFLISTAGYGEYHTGAGAFRFDFTAPGRYRVLAPQVDYYFYFGPKPKAIFEEHKGARDFAMLPARARPASWAGLRDDLLSAVHQAISSATPRRFNLAAYAGAPEELRQRARQVGSLVPGVTAGIVPLTPFRRQLASFFDIYEIETRDQGHPIWHALPFQFPDDPECAHYADEFMLGDELLVAPITATGNQRQIYLPPGNWTSLETNRQYPGRRTIAVETAALPVFARNGAIVPFDSASGIALDYFPRLGGEFFLLEREIGQYTQVHAAQAADILRLEIESKKERDYRWVVHHVERPAAVGLAERKYRGVASAGELADQTWFYNTALKNLTVRVRVRSGEDRIVNVSW